MGPEQAKQLREHTLSEFSRREAELKAVLERGPKTQQDYQLLAGCVGFVLAELQVWKAGKLIPPSNTN